MKMNLISRAQEFAQIKHTGQRDDNGTSHYFHCCKVAQLIIKIVDDHEIIAATYLHDVLEDTDVTFDELEKEFGKKVAFLVFEVTKVGKNFPNLKSRDAILIKFADRLHNLSRMDVWDEKRQEYYLSKSQFWITEEGKKKEE